MTANSLCQLTTLVIAYISRRRTNQTGYRVFLHVFTHINTNHAAFIIKESLCQGLGQLSFTNTSRTKEDKGTDWPLRSLDTSSSSQNSLADYLNSLILTNYPLMEHILQMEQLLSFAGKHLGNRNTSPTAYYLGNILLTNFFLQKLAVRAFGSNGFFLSLQLLLQLWETTIFQFRQLVQIVISFCTFHLAANIVHFLLDATNSQNCLLLRIPLSLQFLLLSLQIFLFLANASQLFLTGCISFLLESLLLNFQLKNLTTHFIQWCRHGFNFSSQLGSSLIHQINGLIWQETVRNVTVRQHCRRHQSRITNTYTMMYLITFLQATENGNSIFYRWFANHNRLETTLQGCILFNVLAVLIQSSSTNAAQLTTSHHWLQQVAGIHSTIGSTSTYYSMYLINEQQNLSIRFYYLVENGF